MFSRPCSSSAASPAPPRSWTSSACIFISKPRAFAALSIFLLWSEKSNPLHRICQNSAIPRVFTFGSISLIADQRESSGLCLYSVGTACAPINVGITSSGVSLDILLITESIFEIPVQGQVRIRSFVYSTVVVPFARADMASFFVLIALLL